MANVGHEGPRLPPLLVPCTSNLKLECMLSNIVNSKFYTYYLKNSETSKKENLRS